MTSTTLLSTLATLSSTSSTCSPTPLTLSSMASVALATRLSTSATLLSMANTVFATPLTLSSTICVAFKFCAAAIRASSCVSLSNLFNASSISVLPTSFFPFFSEHRLVNGDILIPNYSLIRPCFISFVAIPRIERTSTIIQTIVSIISAVGGTSV
ncbi:hypothetical protein DFH94DRAFT_486057 [Russula ochroleuca]|uniref:Uncharacterized protein n=1 Tax=Russula ochroleuca TaxID=152965 RepID=A0A9P5MV92_9AGAM|nr:hypothetical protein DFH94DRAFT_486057 [Russula ochroleuca]